MAKIMLGITLIGIMVISLFSMSYVDSATTGIENEKMMLMLLKAAAGSGIILWLWMIVDVLNKNGLKFKKTWMLSLVFFNVFAALSYFIFIYFPYQRRVQNKK